MSEDAPKSGPRRPSPVDWMGYMAFRGAEWLVRPFPLPMVAWLGAIGGRMFFALSRGYRRLAARNLRIAFGAEKSPAELNAMLWTHASRLGSNFACSLRLPTMPRSEIDTRVEVRGLEHMLTAAKDGKGIVCVIGHIGPWELFTHTRSYLPPGRPAGAIYQALSNPLLDAHVRRSRELLDHKLFERREGFFAAIAMLRSGGVVGVLTDQHAGDAGVFTPFFGRLASTTSLPLLMARKAKASVVAIGIETTGRARWRITVNPMRLPESGEVDFGLPVLNRALELLVRRSPADWFWVHNRWKTPDPAFLLTGHKRGFLLPPPGQLVQPFRVVVRSPNWLGDACMAVPAIRAIKRGRPDLQLTVLCPAKLADMWKTVPEVDAVIGRDTKESVFSVARKLREAGPFDAGVVFPNSPRSAMEMAFGGVDRVVGYAARWRRLFLDQIIPPKADLGPPRHHVEHYLQLAHRIGADCTPRDLFSPLPPPSGGSAAPRNVIRLGLCPGAEYGPAKRWPLDKFATMAEVVIESFGPAIEWTLFGTAAEASLGQELETRLGDRCRNLIGKTTLAGLIDELRSCRLLVSNDTGTMHLAALFGIPVVAIFGSTEPAWTRPLGKQHVILREHVECSPCFLRQCPLDLRCMHAISPDQVAAAVKRALDS